MRYFLKFIANFSIIPLLIGLLFFSNIKGYLRFKSYCSNEGGLRVYEPLEKNVGWVADDYDDAHVAAQLKHVGFVRYTEKKDGNTYDLRYLGGDPQHDSSFEKAPADESKPLAYKWRHVNGAIQDELRLSRSVFEIINVNTNHVSTRFYMFWYHRFGRAHTLFDAPYPVSCFHERGSNFGDFPRSLREINTAFEK
ncbi:MAG: hypothetical protein V4732_18810 [Pseudomonadota bacterium]